MKLSYPQQLRRPEWQKKRLEVLEAAGWSCVACGCADKMLHVHHKQYIKGRSAWDYELSNFESLCEDCHSDAHDQKELIHEILAAIPSVSWAAAASLLAGWAEEYVGEEVISHAHDALAVESGRIAWTMGDLDISKVSELRSCLVELIVRE